MRSSFPRSRRDSRPFEDSRAPADDVPTKNAFDWRCAWINRRTRARATRKRSTRKRSTRDDDRRATRRGGPRGSARVPVDHDDGARDRRGGEFKRTAANPKTRARDGDRSRGRGWRGEDDDADVADLRFFVSHFRDDPIALLDAVSWYERGMIQRIDVGVDDHTQRDHIRLRLLDDQALRLQRQEGREVRPGRPWRSRRSRRSQRSRRSRRSGCSSCANVRLPEMEGMREVCGTIYGLSKRRCLRIRAIHCRSMSRQ